jgi:hypothetical protein
MIVCPPKLVMRLVTRRSQIEGRIYLTSSVRVAIGVAFTPPPPLNILNFNHVAGFLMPPQIFVDGTYQME